MKKSMTSLERWETTVRLEEPDMVPVAPLLQHFFVKQTGITVREYHHDPEKAMQATVKVLEALDGVDAYFPPVMGTAHYSVFPGFSHTSLYLPWRIEENAIPNFYEKSIFEDYEDVMENGFAKYMRPSDLDFDEIYRLNFELPAIVKNLCLDYYRRTGTPLFIGGVSMLPFDLISFMRGIIPSATDLYRRPEKVKEMCDWLVDPLVALAEIGCVGMGAGELPGAQRIFFWGGRSSATFLSPKQFEKFVLPNMLDMVNRFLNDGFDVYLHFDGDYTPMLEMFTALPAKRGIILGVEKTDIVKAKKVLGDRLCLYGNITTTVLKLGTPEEVEAECRKLIEACAPGGGFILGTECEAPWDAPFENMKAMVDSVKKYGVY